MELKQRLALRRLMVPALSQSLNVLALSTQELKNLIEDNLLNNPFLEEKPAGRPSLFPNRQPGGTDFQFDSLPQKTSLQDILLRQLAMFSETDDDCRIGQEIIGNIDENGYLKASLDEISKATGMPLEACEKALKMVQQFEPAGVAARSLKECLLIQLRICGQDDRLLQDIVSLHCDDIAKKNYLAIARSLKEPREKIEALIKNKILKLNPKPGRDFSLEHTQRINPDIIIEEKDDGFFVTVNDENIPALHINKSYRDMLEGNKLKYDNEELLRNKLLEALELIRSVSRRKATLAKIASCLAEIQQEALENDLSRLKPLTFKEVADKLGMHESTVCRAVMNKFAKTPYCGIVAVKDFFTSRISNTDGGSVSSNRIKKLVKELIEQEDKKHPLSDKVIAETILRNNNLKVSRRTVTKYREELKLLSSTFRRER